MLQGNPGRWFEIYVQDIPRAVAFYESVFNLKLQKLDTPGMEMEIWAFPMQRAAMGISGALVKMEGYPSGGNSTLIYFGCEDCAAQAAKVKDAGGKVRKDKFSIGQYGFISLVVDTEGNMFGLHSMT